MIIHVRVDLIFRIWKFLTCKMFADMIYDNAPLTNRYISVPKDFGSFNCAVFIGGILQGMLEQSNFPCKVSTHHVKGGPNNDEPRTVFLISFNQSVMDNARLTSQK
eukprot:gb/GECG01016618.1/.p1 GENE.gb/GECG01016618.1/~~gb/GECG01016618.1/.p1  ORF type:complete len:106 (+),score=6.70 gb/GECG01016618.1/:1-318(+)